MHQLDFSVYPFAWLPREPGFLMPSLAIEGMFGSVPFRLDGLMAPAALNVALQSEFEWRNFDALYMPMSLFKTPLNRTIENLQFTFGLVLDVDLNNYLGVGKDDVLGMSDDLIDDALHELREEVESVLKRYGIQLPHLVVSSGYGLYFYWWLGPSAGDPSYRDDQAKWLRWIADILDDEIGVGLIERNTLDPGTRLTRVVGSINAKGPTERIVTDVKQRDLAPLTVEDLQKAVVPDKVHVPFKPGRPKPLPPELRAKIVDFLIELWTPGRRHQLAMSVCGLMAKWGVDPQEISLVLKEICERTGDDEFDDRLRALGTTMKRLAEGKQVSGFYGLHGVLLGPERQAFEALIRKSDRVMKPRVHVYVPGEESEESEGSGSHEYVPPASETNERVVFSEPPQEAMTGWIGHYIETMQPTTEAPRAFHLGVALTIAGSVIGRKGGVLYGSDVLYPNLYTMLVGASGKTRKDSAIRRGTSLLRNRTFDQGQVSRSIASILTDVGSAEGLLQYLVDHPSTLLHISELSRLLSNANRSATSSIKPMLMELWDSPPMVQTQTRSNPIRVENPFLSVLAAVQPDVLADLVSDSDIHSGFANRWLFVCGNGGRPIPWPEQVASGELDLLVRTLTKAVPSDERTLRLASGARSRWEDWYLERFEVGGSPEELSMQQRVPVNAVKIALIHALLDDHEAIELDDLERGIVTAQWSWENTRLLVAEWGGSNEQRIVARIRAVLLSHPNPIPRPKLVELTQSRRWSVRDFNTMLKAMEESGIVSLNGQGAVSLGG